MTMTRTRGWRGIIAPKLVLGTWLAGMLGVLPAWAQPPRPVPDVMVLDQDGRPQRFYSDLVRGKIVAINFVYTTCTSTCSASGQRFAQLQTLLGDRLGRDVFLITVTTDPDRDTPAMVKTWGAQFGARPGWTLVTGTRANIEQILRALSGGGIFNAASRAKRHTTFVVLLNDARSRWRDTFALTPANRLYQRLTVW